MAEGLAQLSDEYIAAESARIAERARRRTTERAIQAQQDTPAKPNFQERLAARFAEQQQAEAKLTPAEIKAHVDELHTQLDILQRAIEAIKGYTRTPDTQEMEKVQAEVRMYQALDKVGVNLQKLDSVALVRDLTNRAKKAAIDLDYWNAKLPPLDLESPITPDEVEDTLSALN